MIIVKTKCAADGCEKDRKHFHLCCEHMAIEIGVPNCEHNSPEPKGRVLNLKTWTFTHG